MAIAYFKKKINAKHQEFLDEQNRLRAGRIAEEKKKAEARKERIHPKNRVDYWK